MELSDRRRSRCLAARRSRLLSAGLLVFAAAATCGGLAAGAAGQPGGSGKHSGRPGKVPAPGPVRTAHKTARVSGVAGTVASAVARCPRGTSVISGGVRTYANIDIGGSEAQVLIPYASRRSGRRAWKVSVYAIADTPLVARPFTAFAYCRRRAGRVVSRARTVVAGVSGGAPFLPQRSVTARCPYGTRPLSGGFAARLTAADLAAIQSSGGPAVLIFGSRLDVGGWEATIGRFIPGRVRIRAIVYCREGSALKARRKTVLMSGSGVMHSVSTPSCPRHTEALSAGVYAPMQILPGASDLSASVPLNSRRLSSRRWQIGVVPISPATSRATVYAYCG